MFCVFFWILRYQQDRAKSLQNSKFWSPYSWKVSFWLWNSEFEWAFFWFLTPVCYSWTVLLRRRGGSAKKKVLSGMVGFLSVAYSLWTVNAIKSFHSFQAGMSQVGSKQHLWWQFWSIWSDIAPVGLCLRPAGAQHLMWVESLFWTHVRCFSVANCYPSGGFLKARQVSGPLQSRGLVLLLVPELLSKEQPSWQSKTEAFCLS